jgi:hypothetical protein
MKQLMSDQLFLADNIFFKCEVNRLEFTTSGSVIKYNEHQKKMMIISVVIFRVLISRILADPWKYFGEMQVTRNVYFKVKILCSIIYHIFYHFIERTTKVKWDAQHSVVKEFHVKFPKDYLLMNQRAHVKNDEKGYHKYPQNNSDETLSIFCYDSFFTMEELHVFFDGTGRADELLGYGYVLIDKFYEILNEFDESQETHISGVGWLNIEGLKGGIPVNSKFTEGAQKRLHMDKIEFKIGKLGGRGQKPFKSPEKKASKGIPLPLIPLR